MLDITLGQYYPGNSFIHRLDPRTKILTTLILVVAVFLANSAIGYGALCAMVLFIIAISGLPFMLVLKSVKPLLFIIVLTLVLHSLMGQGDHVLYQWGIVKVTEEGLRLGVQMAMRLILLLMISSILTFTTSPIVLTDGIEALLRPFRAVGVPAHELAMMMTIALRFIPTLMEETDRIIKAQTARGADFSSGNLLARAKNMLPILVPLFISAFRRADDLAIAMEARCYRGGEGRTRMHQLAYRSGDMAAFVFAFAMIGLLAFLRWGPKLE
ncbi:MAG: energy-coupling factor transporter transmembrane protein EcfT [Acidaminococcaceae bacterium]|nr:energy-coupling factor transporter transmembrane protein EcfT [Acidaminococcaceae bacterium]HBX75699.1 transporter [Acidaminococcaceae bacterium]